MIPKVRKAAVTADTEESILKEGLSTMTVNAISTVLIRNLTMRLKENRAYTEETENAVTRSNMAMPTILNTKEGEAITGKTAANMSAVIILWENMKAAMKITKGREAQIIQKAAAMAHGTLKTETAGVMRDTRAAQEPMSKGWMNLIAEEMKGGTIRLKAIPGLAGTRIITVLRIASKADMRSGSVTLIKMNHMVKEEKGMKALTSLILTIRTNTLLGAQQKMIVMKNPAGMATDPTILAHTRRTQVIQEDIQTINAADGSARTA